MNLSIEVSGNKTIYKANEFISGNVVVECRESTFAKSLQITCKGSAKVRWTEHHGKTSTTYTGKQKFCNLTIQLFQTQGGQTISSGRNLFPYQFQLPPNLASSLEVQHGYIRYRLQAKLQETVKSKEAEVFFTVVEEVNLNLIPNARHPTSGEESKTLCCCCCTSGLIEGKVNADVMGVVPGQFITANGTVDNQSNSDLKKCRLRIVEVAILHATAWSFTKTRTVEKYITETEFVKRCRRKSSVMLPQERIQLPFVPPSHQRFCNIIDLEYFVELTGQTPKCHFNLKARAPLEVGTIPLDQGSNSDQNQVPAYQSLPPSYVAVTTENPAQGQGNTYYNWDNPAFTYSK